MNVTGVNGRTTRRYDMEADVIAGEEQVAGINLRDLGRNRPAGLVKGCIIKISGATTVNLLIISMLVTDFDRSRRCHQHVGATDYCERGSGLADIGDWQIIPGAI